MTRPRLLHRGALAVLAGALALGGLPSPVAAQRPAKPEAPQGEGARVRELFRKGREEYAKDHLPQAYALFIEAWGLQKSSDLAGNLALVENQLTRYREAAEHATYALANFPAGGTDAQRKALLDVLANARGFVGTLTLRVSVDRTPVTLDGNALGESPFTGEIFVEPGMHTLVAAAPGCEPVKDTVRTGKGTTHLVTLTPTQCGGSKPPPPPLPEEPKGPRPLTVAGFVVTGVGLGVGTALAIMASVKAGDANGKAAQLAPGGCASTPESAACTSLHDALVSHDTFAKAALGTFVTAGVFGAGTLVYAFVVPRAPAAATAPRTQVIPVVGPGVGALTLKGTF